MGKGGKYYGLFCGVNNYRRLTRLKCAVPDAQELSNRFRLQLGYDVELLEDCSQTDVLNALSDFGSKLKPDDTFVFYFSGHGISLGDDDYYCLQGANIARLKEGKPGNDVLPYSVLLEETAHWEGINKIFILDACREIADPAISETRVAYGSPEADDFLKLYQSGDNSEGKLGVLLSCLSGQLAQEVQEDGHGLLCGALKEELDQYERGKPFVLDADMVNSLGKRMKRQLSQKGRAVAQEPELFPKDARFLLGGGAFKEAKPESVGTSLDERMWRLACSYDFIEAYEDYLRNRDIEGVHAEEALARIKALRAETVGAEGGREAVNEEAQRNLEETLERDVELAPVIKKEAAHKAVPASVRSKSEFIDEIKDGGHGPLMVVMPEGSFRMGSVEREHEMPVRHVTVPRFALGKYTVTQREWRALMGHNPSHFTGDENHPVERVSWSEAQAYVTKLSMLTGQYYRLPTEAEWEYACRAGSAGSWTFGDDESLLKEYAWYWDNSGNRTNPVGQRRANAFGLHDMHGNVWEWVEDVWHGSYEGAPTDGSARVKGSDTNCRVHRGGSCFDIKTVLRSSDRFWCHRDHQGSSSGFRIARKLP